MPRQCYCKVNQHYCGTCGECGNFGHFSQHPFLPFTSCWCDPCYDATIANYNEIVTYSDVDYNEDSDVEEAD